MKEEIAIVDNKGIIELPKWEEPDSVDQAIDEINILGVSFHVHGYRVGKYLIWVKREVGHGKFENWFEDNILFFSIDTGQRLMTFSKKCDDKGKLLEYHPRKEKPHGAVFKPKVYDVWNFAECDDRFGIKYPGQIPGQIVQNVLHYYTNKDSLIVDLMAGGGVTNDVCESMSRRCLSYDVKPSRDFIKQHDFRDGLPKDASKADLIFLDPPYFKKKEEQYGDLSISALDREGYLDAIDKLAEVCEGYTVAFVMGKYYDYDQPWNSIFLSDYVNIFEKHGFRQIDEISINQMPPEGGQYDIKDKQSKNKMCILKRDLVIFMWSDALG